jgi:DNA topoisomerase III
MRTSRERVPRLPMADTPLLFHSITYQDFPDDYRRWDSCDPFSLFSAPITTYIPPASKGIATNLTNEARSADLLMIWTDCDREGEHIGSEIVGVCRKGNTRLMVKRARFSAIIPKSVHVS